MLPASFYQVARHRARFHVQLRLESVEAGVTTPGLAKVEASVQRIFRGGAAIQFGERIRFAIGVMRPGDNLPASGIIWKRYEDVSVGRIAEAFLNGEPPNLETALSQYEFIEEPTSRPTLCGSYPLQAFRARIEEMRVRSGR